MGLNSALSSPSSPTSEQVCQKGGGGAVGLDRFTGLCCPTIAFKCFLTLGSTQAQRELLVYFYEFIYVPSCLPADQAVVIQQLSIG